MCVENQNGEGAGKTNLSSILTSYFYQYPHAMFITDRDGTIEYINPVFENLSGYKRNELIGKIRKYFNRERTVPNFTKSFGKPFFPERNTKEIF